MSLIQETHLKNHIMTQVRNIQRGHNLVYKLQVKKLDLRDNMIYEGTNQE